jgi:hypothetical protein
MYYNLISVAAMIRRLRYILTDTHEYEVVSDKNFSVCLVAFIFPATILKKVIQLKFYKLMRAIFYVVGRIGHLTEQIKVELKCVISGFHRAFLWYYVA